MRHDPRLRPCQNDIAPRARPPQARDPGAAADRRRAEGGAGSPPPRVISRGERHPLPPATVRLECGTQASPSAASWQYFRKWAGAPGGVSTPLHCARRWRCGARWLASSCATGLLLLTMTAGSQAASGLAYSTASNWIVQPQPRPGSCHAVGSGLYSRPDPHCTPGALNPKVTQATINRTICRRGWTSTVRPPEWVTEPEKLASMHAYGDHGPMSDYEYDHLVPLELGGATNDPRNLWPEPGASPNPKDRVEDELNRQVCRRQITLAEAQREIASNWVTLAQRPARPPARSHPPRRPTPAPPPPPAAWCSASAQYSSYYNDYDVYVRSNQLDQTVTVSGAGTSATWYTNDSGYADVYFHASPAATGDSLAVQVGAASCFTTL